VFGRVIFIVFVFEKFTRKLTFPDSFFHIFYALVCRWCLAWTWKAT